MRVSGCSVEGVRHIVFTDLDGTLLDRDTYSWDAARPALDRLRRRGVPWIFVTSKTRAEVELLRARLANEHPFIVENGGAAFIPHGYFSFPIPESVSRDGYDVLEFGAAYPALTAALDAAARDTGYAVQAFHEMSAEQAAAACDLPVGEAALALRREYDEPFATLDPRCDTALIDLLTARGFRVLRGGRFYHVCGNNDKAVAVRALHDLFVRAGSRTATIGLGDGWNDLPFLEVVDTPVIVRSAVAVEIKQRLPRAILTAEEGPHGWNQAVLELLG
jgi:mannosyl-3-phosphoglycerate phosphatase